MRASTRSYCDSQSRSSPSRSSGTLSAGTAVGPVPASRSAQFRGSRRGRRRSSPASQPARQPSRHARARALLQRPRATQLANVKSVSKSIISALVGIAIERGHIPDRARTDRRRTSASIFARRPTPPKRRITIEDLLTMRSGLESTSSRNYGAWVTSRNWVRFVLRRELEDTPGTSMEYSTGNTHLLSAILTQATGQSTWQFAQEALAKPLGFSLARWPQDPQGIYFGGNDMLLTPRQMVAVRRALSQSRPRRRGADRASALGRRLVRAARPIGLQRSDVRLRLVDARAAGLQQPAPRGRRHRLFPLSTPGASAGNTSSSSRACSSSSSRPRRRRRERSVGAIAARFSTFCIQ